MEDCQSFPTGSIDNTVGEVSQSKESRSWRLFKKFGVMDLTLLEQPIVSQPQPDEQFQVGIT